ncbi:phosphoribosylformylglycinamidine cyclo-ligase [Clostridium sp. CAG:75]|nr:phosphoribosylformylglycinamidine cyclo-ligase [Clostridium sp. CAG:75]
MMYNTYNMGIGMLLAVDAADADKTVALAEQAGEKAYIIGEIAEGEKGISLLS